MKHLFTLSTLLFFYLVANGQNSICIEYDPVENGGLASICMTMQGGVQACDPNFMVSVGDELNPVETAVLYSYLPNNCFAIMEDAYNEEPPEIIVEVRYECQYDPFNPFSCNWDAPQSLYPTVFATLGDVELTGTAVEDEDFDVVEEIQIKTFTLTIPLHFDHPTMDGLQSELLVITSHNLLGVPNPWNVEYELGAKVTVFGDELLGDPEWTTQAPTLPTLILRDPPGDQSYAYLEESSTTCHGYGMSIGSTNSLEAWASVKLGSAGSVGLIAEAEYEVYAEISGGVEVGMTRTSSEEYEMCFTTTTEYQTTPENGLVGDGDDVYIGTATNYAYGIYKTMMPQQGPNCVDGFHEIKNELILSPLETTNTVVYTHNHIVNNIIPEMQENLTQLDPESAAFETVVDQLEVWLQAVAMNDELKAESEYNTGTSFVGGPGLDESVTLSTSTVKSIEMNMYIDSFVATEVGAEVNGNGASAGVRVRARTDQGSTEFSSNQSTNTVGYHLQDDDATDNFNLAVHTDKTFGTPVFFLNEELSESSCPYEGGYQIDQPSLQFTGGGSELTLEDIPTGTQPTFQIDVCNDSDYDRYYNLKVNPASNTEGAILQGFGENLSATDFGFEILVPANGCISSATITLTQASPQILDYEDIELYLYTFCQPASAPILSSIFLDAYFVEGTGVAESDTPNFDLYPNPNDGNFQIDASNVPAGSVLSIYDLSGRILHQEQINSNGLIDISLNDVASGVYIAELQTSNSKAIKRISIR